MQPTQLTVTHAVTPARVLRDAARYLIEHGWCQSGLFDVDPDRVDPIPAGARPPACALGAVLITVHGTVEQCLRALAGDITDDPTITTEVVEAQVRQFGLEPAGLASGADPRAHDPAVRALAQHLADTDTDSGGLRDWHDTIVEVGPDSVITCWNDAPERILGHVIAGLYGAADQWDQQHPAPVADTRPVAVLVGVA